jgi:alkylation response protein AidB-like acyl-CoA dehydrogenase
VSAPTVGDVAPGREAASSRFLLDERRVLERYMPGLVEVLARPLLELEDPEGGAISAFRDAGGAGLLVPSEYGGLGATPVDAVRIQRAIGSRAPSLAIATTMHHFSVASLVEMVAEDTGMEWMVLEAIAEHRQLLASGFAEGKAGQGILSPTMSARRAEGAWIVTGAKKPCSLSRSMDLLTASVRLQSQGSDDGAMAVVLVPAQSQGIWRKRFWGTSVLVAAESDELVLEDVRVPDRLVFRMDSDGHDRLDRLQTKGFIWFELLISASYLGMASALVERAVQRRKEPVEEVRLVSELEGAMSALEGVTCAMERGERGDDLLARTLFTRYSVQEAVARAAYGAAEALGGMGFIQSPEVAYLLSASRALAFHPPSRVAVSGALAEYLGGEPLRIP